jgi:DNA-binding transcriptional ArsR family regulator
MNVDSSCQQRHHAAMLAPRRPGGRPRGELLADALRVAGLLSSPRTAAELAAASGLPLRTVYRVLRALPAAGWALEVVEAPRGSPGRPLRRYHLASRPAA